PECPTPGPVRQDRRNTAAIVSSILVTAPRHRGCPRPGRHRKVRALSADLPKIPSAGSTRSGHDRCAAQPASEVRARPFLPNTLEQLAVAPAASTSLFAI